jgi:hypothetical protein
MDLESQSNQNLQNKIIKLYWEILEGILLLFY